MHKSTDIETYYEITQPVNLSDDNDRSPVILIHGLAASLFDWIDLVPALSGSGYLSYALDLLGHGKSSKPTQRDLYTMENVFLAFSDWVDKLKIDRPIIVVGHSLGGNLAIQYSLLHPERIRALVLCDPFYTQDQLPRLLRMNYKFSFIDTTFIGNTPEWLIRIMVDMTSLSIRNGYALPENVRKQTTADYKRARPEIFNFVKTMPDLSSSLASVKQPTLVIWGARDSTLRPSSFPTMVQAMPNAVGVPIAGAGHVPHQSHSADFNRYVLDFLNNLS